MNLDFADIETIMSGMGKAMMGTGEAEGEKRAELASEAAINNPLIDDYTLKGAKGLLVNITGGNDITLFEVDEAANKIRAEVDPTADILIGSTIDESMNGKVRVSIVVTGLGGEVVKNKPTLSVVQNRNHGYSKPNLFNNIQSPYSNYSQQAFVQTGYQATQTSAPMASATSNQPAPISGANALDVNTIYETEQNTTVEVNTNYEELQKNIPLDNSLAENFVNEDENLDVLNTNPIEEQSLLDVEKNIKEDHANIESDEIAPQLFTGDQEISEDNQEKSLSDEIDTDLSEINFDDKDDLEIPAFLRRQTN